MQIGIRTPNLKKSIKARTTSKLKRSIKKAATLYIGRNGWASSTTRPSMSIKRCKKSTTVGANPLSSTSKSKCSSSLRTYALKSADTIVASKPREKREFVWPKPKWDAIILGVLYVLALVYYISQGIGLLIILAFYRSFSYPLLGVHRLDWIKK